MAAPDPAQRQAELEADITVAWVTVQAARHAYLRSPNGDRETDRDKAQAHLDSLLEQYASLKLQRAAEAVVTR